MDVSWSEAQRAETNVIARSDDRATITGCDDDAKYEGVSKLNIDAPSTLVKPMRIR
jgi:hypothetical protein